jgi:Mg2+ and Co2+ transporter CorA
MNVQLPSLGFSEGPWQFWEIVGFMTVTSSAMYWWFRRSGWL